MSSMIALCLPKPFFDKYTSDARLPFTISALILQVISFKEFFFAIVENLIDQMSFSVLSSKV